MVRIDGEVKTIVEVMAELKDFPYYCKAFFFGGDPVYLTSSEGFGGVRDGVLFTIFTYLMDGGSYAVV